MFTSAQPGRNLGVITPPMSSVTSIAPSVQLLWIPLGAGQHIVKLNGKAFEALSAFRHRRARCDIYHAALIITVPDGRYTVEMTPIPDGRGSERGVVAEGPVGLKVLGRFRLFRYEIRRWRDGNIPDADEAVKTETLSTDQSFGQRLLGLLPAVPTAVWGRDEMHTGDMWNSNSVVAWLLARGGFDMTTLRPPPGGRAPGWNSGLVVASRSRTGSQPPMSTPLSPLSSI